ncbi:hypothetical protein Tco_0750670, partial [Tanacetum coccineum]
MDCLSVVVAAISNELVSSITQAMNLFLDGKCPKLLGEYIASAPLTPLVKPGGGIRPIAVGTVWRRLVSKIKRLCYKKFVYIIQLSRVGWNSVTPTQLECIMGGTPYGHVKGYSRAWYVDDGTIIGDTLVVRKEDPRSRLAGISPPNISQPSHGVKLLGGPISVDIEFSSELVMKRVAQTIKRMDAISKINDPQCELLLLRACNGISKLYFAMRTCPPRVFESAQRSFDAALPSSFECIVTTSGPGFGDWQSFAFEGLGVYSAGDVLNYAFLASRLQSTDLLSNSSEIAAPKLMKKLADIYFIWVTKTEEYTYFLSPRQMALWKSQLEDHAFDWLRMVPIS